ncbi:hypothetical protein C5U62_32140 [Pseudomonas protegens]|uniref:Type II toxin-antitoxin system HicA family toxin n=1 Tax=Pseudomonas protegens TaxID=380021 RepID=A0A2T6GB40_9PSED|nr:hypothetical protein [Pseudomonas protegens]PUA41376.1 hypothetical protein C5U62_32140 [Pseudomonas protegens]
MPSTLHGIKVRTRQLINFALDNGWQVSRTPGGHLKFTKPGHKPIFISSTPSDYRADRNARANLRRADRHLETL